MEDDPLVEEIGGEETPVVHVEIPVHHQEPQARIIDSRDKPSGSAATTVAQTQQSTRRDLRHIGRDFGSGHSPGGKGS